MRIPLLLCTLALAACSHIETPEERYYATVSFVKATGEVAEVYVDACNKLPKDDPCRDKFPAINSGAKTLKTAMAEANRVFVTKDSPFYDLSLTAAQNAALHLRTVLKD